MHILQPHIKAQIAIRHNIAAPGITVSRLERYYHLARVTSMHHLQGNLPSLYYRLQIGAEYGIAI